MPSPCSVPRWLRWLLPEEPVAAWPCCEDHDTRYERGGSRVERLDADLALYWCLRGAGMWSLSARVYYLAVRLFGAPFWRIPRFSWAWGARRFRYTR